MTDLSSALLSALPSEVLLASASRYRRELLTRLLPEVPWKAPAVNESRLDDEKPDAMAIRLATAKAAAVSGEAPASLVIGSDQVASVDGRILGKPGDHRNAAAQLQACSGREVLFHTAVCIKRIEPAFSETHLDTTTVQFRHLSNNEIDTYLQRDKPWDCAGSFRSEGLGIVLVESMHTRDATALIGLPLIWLAGSLQRAGIELLS